MLDTLHAVWDLDCDDPGIIGLFLKPTMRLTLMRHMRHMSIVEYLAKENENK